MGVITPSVQHDRSRSLNLLGQRGDQAGLADALHTEHRHEPTSPAGRVGPGGAQPRQLRISTDEGGADGVEWQRQQSNRAGRRLALPFQLRILIQDGGLQLAQIGPRLDPQLLRQYASGALERRQRVALPAAAIQREHQLTPEPLAERMRGHERLEFGNQLGRSARGQVGVDPVLEGDDAHLVQPTRLGRAGLDVVETPVRAISPQIQRLTKGGGRALIPAMQLIGTPPSQHLELRCIQLDAPQLEPVAIADRDQHRGWRAGRTTRLEDAA